MKIYTKSGDLGETSTFSGKRVSKSNLRVKLNGQIDELNSVLGMLLSQLDYGRIKESLIRVQSELFELGADVSLGVAITKTKDYYRITLDNVTKLESEIDIWESDLASLKNFILPGGSYIGALSHFARSVCRRAERDAVALATVEKLNPDVLRYLNRLSDWLFVLARTLNKIKGTPEIKFIAPKRKP